MIAVQEAHVSGTGGKTGGNNLFQDLGEGLKENNNAERGRRVVGGLARFVKDHPICHLHGGGMGTKEEQGA